MARAALSLLLIGLVLAQPNQPAAVPRFPLELPVIVAILIAWPGRARGLRTLTVAALVAGVVLKGLDLALHLAFGRPFDPVADLPLLASALELGEGALGPALTLLAALALGAGLAALAAALWWATGIWTRHDPPRRGWALVAVVLAAGVAAADLAAPDRVPGAAFTARLGVDRVTAARRALDDLAAFRKAAAADPWTGRPDPFARLGQAELRIIFVESYGRASFDNPLYAPHAALMAEAEAGIAAQGLAMRSGWLGSPVAGGQSWLAHATLASGLRIDSATRYSALLASPRRTLFELAGASGHETLAVMPGIVRDWPEGRRLGFSRILAAADLGYRGQPFNWVTMPDQFTLAAFDRQGHQPARVAQIVLISSHAPWVPEPRMVPWEKLGDGRIFDAQATAGDPPEVVWRDPGRVRAAYRSSLGYALRAVTAHTARSGHGALTLILGDHPPAPFVSGLPGRDVPAHLIGPPELLAPFDGWGWTEGLIPAPDLPVLPMEAFRDRFLSALSGPP
ncbi:sulfatase [Cereibacter sphaeroides]|uniref:sulfatase n=1 Tax=Cereibacter sphaeroides TaxID=1063 RepID=UPI001F1FAE86|nr:sulfatase [Cereibacter sphaeroides]MCE6958012.1 sulfatase [Cereibacter sphaeroides]MCE6971947.1 sulfatase [Cereibacter sphaeroides]